MWIGFHKGPNSDIIWVDERAETYVPPMCVWSSGPEPDNCCGSDPSCFRIDRDCDSASYALVDHGCGSQYYSICEFGKFQCN